MVELYKFSCSKMYSFFGILHEHDIKNGTIKSVVFCDFPASKNLKTCKTKSATKKTESKKDKDGLLIQIESINKRIDIQKIKSNSRKPGSKHLFLIKITIIW